MDKKARIPLEEKESFLIDPISPFPVQSFSMGFSGEKSPPERKLDSIKWSRKSGRIKCNKAVPASLRNILLGEDQLLLGLFM